MFAVRTSRLAEITQQLLNVTGANNDDVKLYNTAYDGIILISLDEEKTVNVKSIANIDVLILDKIAADEMLDLSKPGGVSSFSSLSRVATDEQYDYFRQLIYNQSSVRR